MAVLSNTLEPILVTLFGMVIEVKPLDEKAQLSIVVTLLGITIEVRFVQLPNAPSPILVTLLGIIIEFKPLQLSNA